MYNKRILITSPSLQIRDNVSGISSLVADIIKHSRLNFSHLRLGSKDRSRKNLIWVAIQLRIYANIVFISLFKRYDCVHLNMSMEKLSILRDSVILITVKKIFRKKVVLHIHGGYYLMHKCGNRLINLLLVNDFTNAEAIIVLSDIEKRRLSESYGNHPFHVLPNAVDTGAFGCLTAQRPPSEIRFVFMARVIECKGIYTISESMQYLTSYFDKFSLHIFGAGPDLAGWLARLEKHPSLKYHFNGVVQGMDKWQALIDADVLLLPSLHGEGMPMVMIEAMAVGCLVIVTDIASVQSVITNNVNGILLSESDPRQLANKMIDIIEGRFDLKSITENAKAYVNAHLSLHDYMIKLENIYATL